jgi:predicted nucleic acid-binding protein
VKECIKSLENLEIELYSSEWALIEMIKALVREFSYSKEKANIIADRFRKKRKIGKLMLHFVDIDSSKACDFKQFFDYLKNQLIEVKDVHLADAIHSLIMSNNNIDTILTTDTQFSVLEKVTSIQPEVFVKIKPKSKS